jgi:sugar phosphate permease
MFGRAAILRNYIQSHYKWYMLALSMLTYGAIAGAERMCMPVLFKEISSDLNLSLVSIGAIWGMDPLAGILVGLPGGLLVDRFGLKRTLAVVSILAGVFCALRGLSVNFISMAFLMFLFGMMAAMTPVITPKITAVWFSRKQLGLTNALISISSSIGSMVATMTSATLLSPLLGGWRQVLFLFGAPAIIAGILWITTGREPRKEELQSLGASQVTLGQALSKVIHIKEVWIYGIISLTLWGANMGLNGYLPLYLRNIGWSPVSADGAMTVLNGASMAGTIPLVILANRLRAYKGMLFFSMVVMSMSLALLPITGGSAIWVLLVVSAFLRGASFSITIVLIFETEGVGGRLGGTAMGLVSSLGMMGGFLAPPLGNSLAGFGPGVPFFFWSALAALSLPQFLFLQKHKQSQETFR